jgi:hypothetical protein
MKYIKSSEIVSFGVIIALCGIIMSWYASRTDVPLQKPAHVSQQFWV